MKENFNNANANNMEEGLLAFIPARGGSKGVPRKNIIDFKGYPLIAYSIAAARLAKHIKRIIVSTDDEAIAEIAIRYGAEVPFLRPAEFAKDNSTDLEVIRHAINWFEENEGGVVKFLAHLRPTTPLRDPAKIDQALEEIKRYPQATSLRSVHELAESPYKLFWLDKDNFLKGFFPEDPRPEYYNLPRQLFPTAYQPNGYVDIIKTDFVKNTDFLHGPNILGFITPVATEVDRIEDLERLRYQLEKYGSPIYEYLKTHFLNRVAV